LLLFESNDEFNIFSQCVADHINPGMVIVVLVIFTMSVLRPK